MRVAHCLYCGVMMTNLRRVQCGAPECQRQAVNERAREFHRAYRERTGTHYAYQFKPHRKLCETCGEPFETREARIRFCSISCTNRSRTWSRECAICGQAFESGRPDGLYCSDACDRLGWRMGRRQVVLYEGPSWRVLRARERVAAALALPRVRKCWYSGRCARCGDWFIHDQAHTNTCSLRCAKRMLGERSKLRRRMHGREPGRPQRWYIFERDEWTCQLCGLPVERDEVVPHPLAPTIDHIIPLAAWPEDDGAVHEDENLQCAHFLCNCLKSDKVAA